MKMLAAVRAHIAVTHKQLAVGQAGFQLKRVDLRHALGANDAVDGDDGLIARDGVVTAMKSCYASAHFPPHFIRCIVEHRFLQADPGLRQTLR